jgi:hypothetical protein
MDDADALTETEQLLLMAAAVHGLGPDASLVCANTARVVDQVLSWRGLTADQIIRGWNELVLPTAHDYVYEALIRMTRHAHSGRAPERAGEPLFEGKGNWGTPGDPDRPACLPQFNSCRLTAHGQQIAQELLSQNPKYRGGSLPRNSI